jgi:hypothetical protein
VNPLIADQTTQAPLCPCHDAAGCPDEATVAINVRELDRLDDLLCEVDEFLRRGNGVAERLTDLCARRGHPHPGSAPATLIDAVCFTTGPRHRVVGVGGLPAGKRR